MAVKISHKGWRDWLVQRISAVIIGLYVLWLTVYECANPTLHFEQWRHLFDGALVKLASFIVLIAIVWHAWIGLWTVLTDYVKHTGLQRALQYLVILLLICYVLWGVEILI
jgi:succinate dehydrogenase membrane anchor subunit